MLISSTTARSIALRGVSNNDPPKTSLAFPLPSICRSTDPSVGNIVLSDMIGVSGANP